ncbi:hypothetical protein [Halobacillus litoralis]|uniref:hypothetical protein n=1 Tax=Halobacillus litoralis TaxID=45668 RepID=UPI001CD8108B|nr:hypothetical protein [Halobacillus litoralis]MCA1021482.1 hypothetical protein [Halobacillus litoralis]
MDLNKEVKSVEIIFENCESIIVPADRFTNFFVSGIKQNMVYQKHLDFKLGELFTYQCEQVSMFISYQDESELDYTYNIDDEPLGMFVGNTTSNRVSDRPNILGRVVDSNDITHLYFLDENEDELFKLAVPFEGEWNNSLMSVDKRYGSKSNTLVVNIAKENKKEDEE